MSALLLLFTFLFLGGLCLLGAYADSDDEESDVSEKPAQSKEANGNQSADIDSTLANFLAVSSTFAWVFKILKPLWNLDLNWLAYLSICVSLSLLPLHPSSLVPPHLSLSSFCQGCKREKWRIERFGGTCVIGR